MSVPLPDPDRARVLAEAGPAHRPAVRREAGDLATPVEMLRHADRVAEQADYQESRDRSRENTAAIAELRRVAARLRQDYAFPG